MAAIFISNSLRQIIELTLKQRPETMVDVSIGLWEEFTPRLIIIIGEDNFQSLFFRSGQITANIFPWMKFCDCFCRASEYKFIELKKCLEEQGMVESSAASASLLHAFIDILSLIIGDVLSENLLAPVSPPL